MADQPLLRLILRRPDCVRGESVPFDLVLENSTPDPINQLHTFEPMNEATFIEAVRVADRPGAAPLDEPAKAKPIIGCAMSPSHRDGVHVHGPDEPERTTLRPGQSLRTSGDLLKWLGELEPGVYELVASHRGMLQPYLSPPVTLHVQPLRPVALATPRNGLRAPVTPLTGAWLHDGDAGPVLFYGLQSDRLPRNGLAGLRSGAASVGAALHPSTIPADKLPAVHVLTSERSRLQVLTVDPAYKTPPQAAPVRGVRGQVLNSPLSMPDGSVFAALAENGGQTLTLARIKPSGDAVTHDVNLGKPVSLGAYSCCWELVSKLHFAWVTPGGREVLVATLFLDDPGAGVQVRSANFADAPVLWIEYYLDPRQIIGGPPMFEHNVRPGEQPADVPGSPAEMIWCVLRRGDQLVCTRGFSGSKIHKPEAAFDVSNIPDPKVIASTLNLDGSLCLLIADARGRVHYASASTGSITHVTDPAGRDITPAQSPGLLAASEDAALAWIYVRYMDPAGGRIAWLKLEPAGEPEPPLTGHHVH